MANNSFEYGVQNIKYDGQRTSIPKEINNVKDKLVGNFSIRECFFIVTAIVVFYFTLKLFSGISYLKEYSLIISAILSLIPIGIGFYKVNGFTMSDLFLFLNVNLRLSSPSRYPTMRNEYEKLEAIHFSKQKKFKEKWRFRRKKLRFTKARGR